LFLQPLVLAALSVSFAPPQGPDVHTTRIGIDANYALNMAERAKVWKDGAVEADPYELFAQHGCQSARIRLWVGDDGVNR